MSTSPRPGVTRLASAALVLAVAAATLAACGTDSSSGSDASGGAPGVTDDKVSIGISAGVTGPVAAVAGPFVEGVELYLDHVNDAGGVHDRDVELVIADDAYDTARSVSNTRKFVAEKNVFGLIGFTAQFEASKPLTCEKDVPVIFSAAIEATGSCYKMYAGPDGTLIGSARYLADTYGEDALARVALYAQNDDYGEVSEKAAEAIAAKYGSEWKKFSIDRAATDASSQAKQIEDFKPTAILMGATPTVNALLLTDLVGQGVTLGDSGVHVVGTDTIDANVVALAGKAAEGAIGVTPVLDLSDTSNPQVAQFNADVKKFAPNTEVLPYTLIGYATAQSWVAGLQAAGKDLTQKKWRDAIAGVTDLETTQGAMDFSAEDHLASKLVQIVQVKDGKLQFLATARPTTLD